MNKDFFALFDLSVQFDIDMPALESRYIELQRQLHPDKFAGKTPQEKLVAQGRAVDINNAYNIVKNPLLRAGYLLKLNGIDFDIQKEQTIFNQDLLMEMMQRREELEDMSSPADFATAARNIGIEIEENYKKLSAQLAAKKYDDVKSMMLRQQYLQKIVAEIRQKQADLLEGAA